MMTPKKSLAIGQQFYIFGIVHGHLGNFHGYFGIVHGH